MAGERHGAARALLPAAVLAAAVWSVGLQPGVVRARRDQALRSLHVDLLRMAMDDEVYRRCWGDFFDSADPEQQRAQLYVNMIFSHWELMFELNALTEVALREAAHIVLAGSDGRRFWEGSRDIRAKSASTRRKRRFHEIVDGEYLCLPTPSAGPTPSPTSGSG
ncbi:MULTISPECIES: DUF6082 family protein [Pseudofrankia]|uniref:DUF6082 family protein n=1 Tax=Pseudofrankia TaxID=2994363 RepID=UPI000234BEC3|nr:MULTISPECIES: DUF6082 family protein [Pseudofrankia]